MQGELRVKTSAKVSYHNATKVTKNKKKEGELIYIWQVKSIFDPAPRLEFHV